MPREEEMHLAKLAKEGDRAAVRLLLEENVKYVTSIAYTLKRYRVEIEDLVSEGKIGLMEAVSRFDPDKGCRFITYASWWIRAYMLRFIVESWNMVGGFAGGGDNSSVFFRLGKERSRIESFTTDEEVVTQKLAEVFGVTVERMQYMIDRFETKICFLNSPLRDREDGSTLMDTIASTDPSPEADAVDEERRRGAAGKIAKARKTLDARENFIVERKWLSKDGEDVSLADLGREMGISRERARQIEARAIGKLRQSLGALGA
jgi:RNA polymerase sigma-32 factor